MYFLETRRKTLEEIAAAFRDDVVNIDVRGGAFVAGRGTDSDGDGDGHMLGLRRGRGVDANESLRRGLGFGGVSRV